MLEKLTVSTWYRFLLLLRVGVLVALSFERRATAVAAAAAAVVAAFTADRVRRPGVSYGAPEATVLEDGRAFVEREEEEAATARSRSPWRGRSQENTKSITRSDKDRVVVTAASLAEEEEDKDEEEDEKEDDEVDEEGGGEDEEEKDGAEEEGSAMAVEGKAPRDR
jgi:hypothetical protein